MFRKRKESPPWDILVPRSQQETGVSKWQMLLNRDLAFKELVEMEASNVTQFPSVVGYRKPWWWLVVAHSLCLGHRQLNCRQSASLGLWLPLGTIIILHDNREYPIIILFLSTGRGLLCIFCILCSVLNHFVMWNMSIESLCVVHSYGFMQRLSKKNLL